MKSLKNLFGFGKIARKRNTPRISAQSQVEGLEERLVLTASPLPVLMVIADQHDFYYKEYGDTRQSLENEGVAVQVAATTTAVSLPHVGTGEPEGTDGAVTPDLTLAQVNPDDYSAIVFVGGWGSSMYQYAFPGDYLNDNYDGDLATKQIVNDLINEFIADDKYVTAICHGTTVLAWARVDGVSPLDGKLVSVPYIGSPAVTYEGIEYGNFSLGQYEQAVANGAIPNLVSGQYGEAWTVTDDVVVDGRIITAENYDAALQFGLVVAQQVKAAAAELPVENQAPIVSDASWLLEENSPLGTVVGTVSATDVDAGQSLTYAITAGNTNNAFAIDPATGQITVANAAAINFEALPEFQLQVQVNDDSENSLSGTAIITIQLLNVPELAIPGVFRFADDLVVQGSSAQDVIYIWSGGNASEIFVWMNDVFYGSNTLSPNGTFTVYGGAGNDQIFATDVRHRVSIFGEGGHDLISGGSADDMLDGGDGVDRLWAGAGNDLVRGGSGDDFLYGCEGDDILVGDAGNDSLDGGFGRDLLIGGLGSDYLKGGAGDDLLIGGLTDYDEDHQALEAVRAVWTGPDNITDRQNHLEIGIGLGIQFAPGETVHDDGVADTVCGGDDLDLVFAGLGEQLYLGSEDLLLETNQI